MIKTEALLTILIRTDPAASERKHAASVFPFILPPLCVLLVMKSFIEADPSPRWTQQGPPAPLSCPPMSVYVLKCCTKAINQTRPAGLQAGGSRQAQPCWFSCVLRRPNLCPWGHICPRQQPTNYPRSNKGVGVDLSWIEWTFWQRVAVCIYDDAFCSVSRPLLRKGTFPSLFGIQQSPYLDSTGVQNILKLNCSWGFWCCSI